MMLLAGATIVLYIIIKENARKIFMNFGLYFSNLFI